MAAVHDFVAESKGHCFLCWNNILKSDCSTHYSLHCLARYLKLDMRKVFTGNGPIPHHLVARVESSRLKAELCEECALLNGKFLKLFRKLERIEMEVGSFLSFIQDKLEKDGAKFESVIKTENDEWIAKLEITEALRKDAKQKCSLRLGTLLPLTRLEKLTRKQVKAEKLKLESRKAAKRKRSRTPTAMQDFDSSFDDGKSCGSPMSALAAADEDGTNFLNEDAHCIDSPMLGDDHYATGLETMKHETIDRAGVTDQVTHLDLDMEINEGEVSEQYLQTSNIAKHTKGKDTTADQISKAIPPPITTVGSGGNVSKPKAIKNPETGKFKCPICRKEYTLSQNYQLHYKSSHLNVRYICGLCKKDFPQKHVYERHYISVHMGVRFKCGKCNKTFTQKGYLIKHQKHVHLGE